MTRRITYTAIIGGYDDLPEIARRAPDSELVVFTDTPAALPRDTGWTIVPIRPFFTDNKITSGFIKSNPHLLFGAEAVTLWLDASLAAVDTAALFAALEAAEGPVLTLDHTQRDTVAAEVERVIAMRVERDGIARAHLARIRAAGFPDDRGLSALMMLGRDLRDPRTRLLDEAWWGCIATGVRRDQLSFDYALWAAGIARSLLPPRHGAFGFKAEGHLKPAGRLLDRRSVPEELPGVAPAMPPLSRGYPTGIGYVAERFTPRAIDMLRAINDRIAAVAPGGEVEGNYCFFHRAVVTPFSPPDPGRAWKREFLRRAVQGCRGVLEVGFNAGHSAVIMLEAEPALALTAVDICTHPYTQPCAGLLGAAYGARFAFIPGDSRAVLGGIDGAAFDLVHIDGGHGADVAAHDLGWFCRAARPGCRLLVDDVYAPAIARLVQQACAAGLIAPLDYGFASSGENALFVRSEGRGPA
jgi:hypothetical protein